MHIAYPFFRAGCCPTAQIVTCIDMAGAHAHSLSNTLTLIVTLMDCVPIWHGNTSKGGYAAAVCFHVLPDVIAHSGTSICRSTAKRYPMCGRRSKICHMRAAVQVTVRQGLLWVKVLGDFSLPRNE